MSSSYDVGKTRDSAIETKATACSNSPTGEHEWVAHGSWPSMWEECSCCRVTVYWK